MISGGSRFWSSTTSDWEINSSLGGLNCDFRPVDSLEAKMGFSVADMFFGLS